MATSKDTRVRVEGLSKIIASVRPASGRFIVGRAALALEDARRLDQRPQRRGIVIGDVEEMRAPWHHRAAIGGFERGERPVEAAHRLVDLGLGDVERRQQAHDVVAGAGARAGPRSRMATTTSAAGTTQRMPSSSPSPRTSLTTAPWPSATDASRCFR